jgi:hypothetical protein
MGVIWILINNSRIVHLPVIGEDVNTPSNPVNVSVFASAINNRNFSSNVSVNTPTFGRITIKLVPDGRTGECNQCGQCCSHPVGDCPHPPDCGYVPITNKGVDYHACQYLTVFSGSNKGIGANNGTECSMRSDILNIAKGCVLFPQKPSEIESWMTACSFSFSG